MSTAESFLRRHWNRSRTQPAASAATPGFSGFGIGAPTLPPVETGPAPEGGASQRAELDLCLDVPASIETAQMLDLDLDGLESATDTLDVSLGDSRPVASVITALPASAERRVDLDLPLETVPAILWRSDLGGLDDELPARGNLNADPGPRNASGQATRSAPVPAGTRLPAATLGTDADPADARPRWQGLLDTTLAKAWAQSQLVALLHVGSSRLDDVEGALGAAAQAAAHAAHGERLQTLLAEPDVAQLVVGARVQSIAGAHLLILPGLRSASGAESLARRCIEALSRPVEIGSLRLSLPAAVGISIFPHDGQQTAPLLRAAEVAWRHAREPGRSGYQFYAMEMEARSLRRLTVEAAFREAIVQNTLGLNFEPQIDLRGGKIAAAQVGLQWQPPEGAPLDTAGVLALAEEVGLAEVLAHSLVTRASQHLQRCQAQGLRSQRLTVPILPSALRRRYSVQRLHEILYDHAILPGQLTLLLVPGAGDCVAAMEPGSTGAQQRPSARDCALRLQPLADAGFGLAVDGSACSAAALAQLRLLPLTEFHLNVRLLDSLDQGDGTLVSALVQLGQRLHLRLVATALDAEPQFERLCQLGVDAVQGSLLSEPLSGETWLELLVGANGLHDQAVASLMGAVPAMGALAGVPADASPAPVFAWPTTRGGVVPAGAACDISVHGLTASASLG